MELGSEFDLNVESLSKKQNNIYKYLSAYNSVYYNSGRSAFMALDFVLPEGKVIIPEYLCDCVAKSFTRLQVEYVKVDKYLNYDLDDLYNKMDGEVSALIIMNYFGHLHDRETFKEIRKLKEKYGFAIIEDTTHSIFSAASVIGDYCVCSLRKWFPIPDGGVLYSKSDISDISSLIYNSNKDLEKTYAMMLKSLYLNTGFDCNEEYRKIFLRSEDRLNLQNQPVLLSDFSAFLLECYDVEAISEKRKRNFEYVYNRLKDCKYIQSFINFKNREYPFTFPVYIDSRDKFRNYLIRHNIYCAVHWPIEENLKKKASVVSDISGKIISLPIDQRYNIKELDYMLGIIKRYFDEECKC